MYTGDLLGLPKTRTKASSAHLLERFGLQDAGSRPIRQYSSGMCRRLALAATLITEPKVLLLDEPTAGLDPQGSELVVEILAERAAAGCAVLMASHHLQEVEQICNRVLLLHQGRIAMAGTLDELLGTGATRLVFTGLDDADIAGVEARVEDAGGTVVERGVEREHLFALFRRLDPHAGAPDQP
jgi:ABC-2 type transport system ATP-binding protein